MHDRSSVTSTVIRYATAADALALSALLSQLGYPSPPESLPGRLERLAANAGAAALVAVRNDRIVGLATMHIITPINRERDVAWLTTLVVDEAARGTGVGRALVEAVEARARDAGCERLSVTTHENRSQAHEFYARIGFERTGRRFGMTLV
ncbi:MAG TPA: GNAT family N-acetyltransferase [Longimicrobiales bacterium]